MRARIWAAQGRLDEAIGWAREHRLSVEDDLSYLREFEHIMLARLLMARSKQDKAERPRRDAVAPRHGRAHASAVYLTRVKEAR